MLKHLDGFVSEEVLTRIEGAKEEVAKVRGGGTTWRQNEAVREFYDCVRKLLGTALRQHLESKFSQFASGMIDQAKAVHPQISAELLAVVDGRLKAIESSLNLATADQKTKVSSYLADMLDNLPQLHSAAREQPAAVLPQPEPQKQSSAVGPKPTTYEIPDGAMGYGYERIFGQFLAGSEEIVIEDPHIRFRYQIENLRRLCGIVVSAGYVKKIILKSGAKFGEDTDEADSELETLKRDLAANHKVKFEFSRSEKLHDREVKFSNGWIVQIGHGLDIYYKPESWASVGASDYNLRKCRQTKVTVLRKDS